MALTAKTCTPCRGRVPPLTRAEAERLLGETPGWTLSDDATRIERSFSFADGHTELLVVLEGSMRTHERPCWSRSSIARELQSLLSHTVHHYAFIAVALRLQGVEPASDFGVAPSTLEYWRQTA